MKRTGLFTIDTHASNADICAAIRIVRWLPGVIWCDLAGPETGIKHKPKIYATSRPAEFTVRYDGQITTGRTLFRHCEKEVTTA
jgi:hypothetical protein